MDLSKPGRGRLPERREQMMRAEGRLFLVYFVAFLLSALLGLLAAAPAQAEPWLSTRYAQNCASCHAPGRKNLKPVDRRCTLSCQGCHVNPNGGGLRSGYGKWNEDRWLRSFRASVLEHEKSTAPTERQHYGRSAARGKDGGKVGDDKDRKKGRDKLGKRRMPRSGYPLIETDEVYPPETNFLRDGREYEVVDQDEFLEQVPQQDPYRTLEDQKTDAGADIRWQWASLDRDGEKVSSNFLMAADFALRWRPVYRNVHLVYEARSQGIPDQKIETTLGAAKTRSLYLMVDNLPYNVFVMGGYYRPLFGNFVPDHYALAQMLSSYAMTGQSKNYNLLFSALSVGTAPNVPYLNLHRINKIVGDPDDKTQGFAINAGLRFVSFGGSLNYSYWRTDDEREDRVTGVEMHSANAAARLGRVIASLEGVSVSRDVDTQDFRQGGVYALDTYTQLWREIYFAAMYSTSNVATDLSPGEASQMKAGIRAFLTPGVDLMLLYETMEETRESLKATAKVSGVTGQLHVYF